MKSFFFLKKINLNEKKKKYLRILRKERFQIVASIRHGRRRAVKTQDKTAGLVPFIYIMN